MEEWRGGGNNVYLSGRGVSGGIREDVGSSGDLGMLLDQFINQPIFHPNQPKSRFKLNNKIVIKLNRKQCIFLPLNHNLL